MLFLSISATGKPAYEDIYKFLKKFKTKGTTNSKQQIKPNTLLYTLHTNTKRQTFLVEADDGQEMESEGDWVGFEEEERESVANYLPLLYTPNPSLLSNIKRQEKQA